MTPPDALFIPRPLDYSATFLWALSGAIVAERRQYDAALPACAAYLLMTTLGVGATVAGWASVALAFAIRMASVRFELATRTLRSPSRPPAGPSPPGPTGERNE